MRPFLPIRLLTASLVLALAVPLLAQQEIGPRADYKPLISKLDGFIQREVKDKDLPGLAIALLDGDEIVWAKGYGELSPHSICRVGSISKLVTDTAVMQLVEQGKLDLDAPITDYLPELKFIGSDKTKATVTLRQLMTHHAGILREPPKGHYFDADTPALAATVDSMAGTPLIYKPGSRFKYSNAGLAIVGRVLEKVAGKPFAEQTQAAVLDPAGMQESSFRPDDKLRQRVAKAHMWTYDGRRFAAPKFDLGMMPAADLYASVTDLVQFARQWFVGEHRPEKTLLKEATQKSMFKPQAGKKFVGLGFFLEEVEYELKVGHTGAMYGFASELQALPEKGLAVAVVTNLDFANNIPQRIATEALRVGLKKRRGVGYTAPAGSSNVDAETRKAIAGWYGLGRHRLQIFQRGDQLFVDTPVGFRQRLRKSGALLIADDHFHFGGRYLQLEDGGLRWNRANLKRLPDYKPEPCPKEYLALIGEYGWDYDVLYVYERCGELRILIEWFASYPLAKALGPEQFKLADEGMYRGEPVTFEKGSDGKISGVKVGGVLFPRRRVGPDDGVTFKIKRRFPPERLRAMAAEVRKPKEQGEFREADLVELKGLMPGLKLDLRYATTNNFMDMKFYGVVKAMMQKPAAEALARVQKRLEKRGMGLVIYDAYRPWRVTKMFWDATPEHQKTFVANPKRGSRHNRGCAVDLGLVDLGTGKILPMVSGYDEFTERAYADYPGTTSLRRWYREVLRQAMHAESLHVYEFEWWHFDYKDWRKYPILDQPLK
jgi:CubicO group peptidase (beta-lactamase class C family)/D-alanyl-D-alanine dipeptidase